MSVYENVRFAQIGYAAVFDRERKRFWADENYLTKHLEKQISVRTAMRINIENLKSFEHRFSLHKVRYRATFTPFYERFFLCRVYPEDSYMKCAYSELYKLISDMRMRAAEMICTLRKLDEHIIALGNDALCREHTAKLLSDAEKEYASATDIMKMFDKQHIFEYIPIKSYLEKTRKRIRQSNSILGKNVALEVDLKHSVARVNYVLFEAAISCLVKLFYKILQPDESVTLKLKGTESGSISVRTEFFADAPIDMSDTELDVSLIKCIFEALDGVSVLDITGNRIVFKGDIPVSLSNYFNRIKGIYEDFDENEYYDPEARSIMNIDESYKNKPFILHSRPNQYNGDLLELVWNIAMNSLYEKKIS